MKHFTWNIQVIDHIITDLDDFEDDIVFQAQNTVSA